MMYTETRQLTPNRWPNRNELLGVVLHHTVGFWRSDLEALTTRRGAKSVSAHVLIGRAGQRAVLADDRDVTWHAGISRWRGKEGCNNFTLGVELEGNTLENGLADAQIGSLMEYLVPRMLLHRWTPDDVTHHRVVSPGRKVDLLPYEFDRVQAVLQGWQGRGRPAWSAEEHGRALADLRQHDAQAGGRP
jgi:N-acetyl-anhydromuramyl-L-alanine amidase AmpD